MKKEEIPFLLKALKLEYESEYKFLSNRKFRFDFALLDKKIAIEYEGVFQSKRGKSRHTNVMGYSKDCEKYNLAQLSGWIVLRYTALNLSDLPKHLNKIYK